MNPCIESVLMRLPSRILVIAISMLAVVPVMAQDARSLFQSYHDRIYQIQTIELNSGSKSSLGSGFQVNANGLMVTNFHVVANFVQEPDKYRIEYIAHDGKTGSLEVKDIDLVNDLALIKHDGGYTEYLELASDEVPQGAEIFSLGNPHDLGMTVIPGTYNSLTAHSYYDRIHFSGSINPGMSGGPALDSGGRVIGVNVATAGNQISFLVPLNKLRALLDQYDGTQYSMDELRHRLQNQLVMNQRAYVEKLIDADWPVSRLGNGFVIGEMTPYTRCWGTSSEANDNRLRYNITNTNCINNEFIYLSNWFTTGGLQYEFSWLDTSELNAFQFYQAYQEHIRGASPINAARKQDVTNFECHEGFTRGESDHVITKSILCIRAYLEYDGLYDFLYTGAAISGENYGLISHFTISGVEKGPGIEFTRKFIENVSATGAARDPVE